MLGKLTGNGFHKTDENYNFKMKLEKMKEKENGIQKQITEKATIGFQNYQKV